MSQTVFFGPFIGEFGWELLFWQGWVREQCLTTFAASRKIAASYPGREPFYPYVDEFWPLPDDFVQARFSGHNYILDGWRHGYPGTTKSVRTYKYGVIPRWSWPESPLSTMDTERVAEQVLETFRQRLPSDATCFIPWRYQRFAGVAFGPCISDRPRSTADFVVHRIPFSHQRLEAIGQTHEGERLFKALVPTETRMIAVFPRFRSVRRTDKNWSAENYRDLIGRLQSRFPRLVIAILGAPGGAYFEDGVPKDCMDFINVPERHRMDLQIAALKRCILAVGSMSGAILVALAAGCPSLTWGYPGERDRYHQENFLKTRFYYHPEMDASVQEIFEMATSMIEDERSPSYHRSFFRRAMRAYRHVVRACQ